MTTYREDGLKEKSIKNVFLSTAAIGSIFMAAPSIAIAQDDGADDGRDVIVVTARNREESLQDVPLAITAFDEEALKRRSIDSLDDVARFTSGLSFEDFSSGFATPIIRGQAQTRVTALEGNVSTFFDGIYIPRSWAVDVGTTSLQRVEVVKGPQSARYGRNAFAGAINYIPLKATPGSVEENLIAEVTGTIGSDERYDAGFKANLPFGDRAAVAGSYNYSTFDGTWNNDHPFAGLDLDPGTNGNVGGYERTSYSASLYLNPIDPLTVEVSYHSFVNDNEARASRGLAEVVGDGNCGTQRGFNPGPALICGDLPGPGETVTVDPRGFGTQSDTSLFRARAAFDLTDSLEISYLFGKIEGDVDIFVSSDPDPVNCGTLIGTPANPLCNFQSTPIGSIDYDSHEVRLTFDNDGPIRGAIGGFFSNGEDDFTFTSFNIFPITDPNNFQLPDSPPSPTGLTGFFDPPFAPANFTLQDDVTTTDVTSIFGEAQWTSSDGGFRLGAEARYSETEITTVFTPLFGPATSLNDTFKVFTPRVTAEYDLNDSSLIYASVARGAKAGGFNSGAIDPVNRVFGEEFNWTYEAGAKNTFLDGNLILNAALFYTDWSEIQINSPDPDAVDPNSVNITLNLGDARVFGVELDAFYQATDNLSFDATFSHSDAQYRDGTVDARLLRTGAGGFFGPSCDDIVCNSNGDVGGNQVERTPPTQLSFGSQWEGDLSQWGASYYIRGDASWQSDFFATPANVGTIPDRFLLNASAGMSFDHVDVTLWARNLTDKQYLSNAFVVLLPFGNSYNTFFGDRRSFGATVTVRY